MQKEQRNTRITNANVCDCHINCYLTCDGVVRLLARAGTECVVTARI